MNEGNGPEAGSHGTLIWAIRTAGIAGFVGLIAVQYFARQAHDIREPTRVAQGGKMPGAVDPETTGSIALGARGARLDPCAALSGARAARP